MPDRGVDRGAAQAGRVRGIVGKALMASAIVMVSVAAAAWLDWLPLNPTVRTYVALAFLVAGAVDAVLALRFLGERAS